MDEVIRRRKVYGERGVDKLDRGLSFVDWPLIRVIRGLFSFVAANGYLRLPPEDRTK